MKRVIIALTIAAAMTGSAIADGGTAGRFVPDAELVGKARFKYLAFSVFDAELYAPAGEWQSGKPYLLTLTYLRSFTADQIAESAVDQIRRQGYRNDAKLDQWQRQLEAIFPNVSKGERISGLKDASGYARFFSNGREIGAVRDRAFADRFFKIWLGERAADRGFRRRLLGLAS